MSSQWEHNFPWSQGFCSLQCSNQCLEQCLALGNSSKTKWKNEWVVGGPRNYFCLYHCLIFCVTEITFHLTFSSYTYFIPYHIWENCSLLYWPRCGSALWWTYFKFSILYLFFIPIWETILHLTFERCEWMFMFLDKNKCSVVECYNIIMLSTVKMTFNHVIS